VKRVVRVLVVDDSPVALAAICSCLETDGAIEVVGTAKNGFELPEMAEQLQPDVIVTDLHMPRMNGLECTLSLREMMPTTRFIIISDTPAPAGSISQTSAHSGRYFDKSTSPEEVLDEIRRLFPEVFGATREGNVPTSQERNTPGKRAPAADKLSAETPSAKPEDSGEPGYC